MARAKSPEKHAAILAAAAEEIAFAGTSASTAAIARRAGVAEGTLFTYFETKEHLLNELYLELKASGYASLFHEFPSKASLELRTRHIWTAYLLWMANHPTQHRALAQLKVSEIITPATRNTAASGRNEIQAVLDQLAARTGTRSLSTDYIAALMLAMQEATVDFVTQYPRQRRHYIESGFAAFWRAVR